MKVKRDPDCTRCPLHKTADFVCLLGVGPPKAKVMIVGEAPGERENDSGVPFVGKAGQLLDAMMENVGLSRDEIFITNAVSCRPPGNRAPTRREMNACKYWLDQQIAAVQPKFVALLGNVALESVLGIKGIKKLRGKPIEKDGVTYLPMLHPSYVLRGDLVDKPTAEHDLRKLRDIIEFGGIPEERGLDMHIVNTDAEIEAMLASLAGIVSFDLETTALYPWGKDARIVSFGFGTSSGEYLLPSFHRESPWSDREMRHILDRVTERLRQCIVIAHNGKFDQLWVRVHHNIMWPIDFDTMLAHHLLDENSRHDLENLARIYFSAPDWDIELAEKQGNAPFQKIAKYQAHDVYYTRLLYHKLKPLLNNDPDSKRLFENLVVPAANLYVEMEHRGCYVDLARMDQVERHLRREIDAAERRLKKWGNINWASPKQVAHLLYHDLRIKCPLQTKKGAPSSAESALKMIEHPCVTDLLVYRGHKQQLSFFIEGWKPYIHEQRIHPSFKLHGTVTGRPSCAHPNFQQVPRDSTIRSLITAPPGWTLLEADLSQIELRIIAELSRVPSMMDAFMNGRDIHWKTVLGEIERYAGQRDLVLATARKLDSKITSYADAIALLHEIGPDKAIDIDSAWKEMRKKAKAVGFGYCVAEGSQVQIPGGTKNIEDIRTGDLVYSYNDQRQLCLKRVIAHEYMGEKECYRIRWQGGRGNSGYLDVTGDHEVRLIDGSYCRADQLMKLPRPRQVLALHRKVMQNRNYLGITGVHPGPEEARFVFEQINGYLPEHVHHKDHNSLNDHPDNLQGMTKSEHKKLHPSPKRLDYFFTRKQLEEARRTSINQVSTKIGCPYRCLRRAVNNHWIMSVRKIGKRRVYDIEVEDTHNFIANEICIKNCYGMGWKKFMQYARDNYDMHLTEREARESRIAYFQMYPLEAWHQRQRNFAHSEGYVRALDGRKRHLPMAQDNRDSPERAEAHRQAINSPVQGFASDINLMVLLEMRRAFPRSVFQPVITVHDSILMEVRDDYVERVAAHIEQVMRRPRLFDVFDIHLTVPIGGDTKAGPWGSGVSMEKWNGRHTS